MMPGMNPRQMKKMMQRMGISQEEIDAEVVIIKTSDKELVILNPNVVKVNMSGQESFQITGEVQERAAEADISEDDINTVMEQTNVDEAAAKKALEESDGDIAGAILKLS